MAVGLIMAWLLYSAVERSTAFLYNDIMLTTQWRGPNAFVFH